MTPLKTPLIIVDTETTGLLKHKDATPWDVGAVIINTDGQEVGHFDRCGCPATIPNDARDALRVSAMTVDDIKQLPPFSSVRDEFIAWLKSTAILYPTVQITAFNVAFDRVMLERVGITTKIPWAPCVMETAKTVMVKSDRNPLPWNDYFQDYKIPKLTEAAAFFNVTPHEPAHRAIGYARTTAAIVRAMKGL